MVPITDLENIIADLNKDRIATVAEFLCKVFKEKVVEVYQGDIYEEISFDQISSTYPAVFSGKVIAAYEHCLVLEGSYIDRKTNRRKLGKQIFISDRCIKALCEVDGKGILDDIFLRSRETIELKAMALIKDFKNNK
jgi:hypothetical protein